MTTSRLIDATSDMNYVIPAITVDKDKYYQQYAVHIGAIIGKESDGEDRYASFCGQDYYSWMKEVTVNEAPEITCKKCLHILRNLTNIKDSESVHTVISNRLNTRLLKVHVKKEHSNYTNSEPINPLEEEPVNRVLGVPIMEIPVAYCRDKTYEQRLGMLAATSEYLTKKYEALKPLRDSAVLLARCGFTSSFIDVINEYNLGVSNLRAMMAELNNTATKIKNV